MFFYKNPLVDGLIQSGLFQHSGQNVDSATELVIAPIYEKNDKIKRGNKISPELSKQWKRTNKKSKLNKTNITKHKNTRTTSIMR